MFILTLTIYVLTFNISVYGQIPFSSTSLKETGDFSALMVEGINRFLTIETEHVKQAREDFWQRDFSSIEAFNKSIVSQRNLLAKRVGVVDSRLESMMEVLTNKRLEQINSETKSCIIRAVRWNVLDGLSSEGLLLEPKGKVLARVVMLPDADVLPEVLAGLEKAGDSGCGVARRLAEAGCEVLIPVLVSRDDTFSGSQLVGLFTNQPHREWIYRQGYEVGRHIIGYELQKIFAAIDWMEWRNKSEGSDVLIGVAGHGEGGLLALYAAALDTRISSALVSGYFDDREQVWSEPIYHNIFGLLKYFGDAELAVMTWPRNLVVEHSIAPEVSGSGATPGRMTTPDLTTVEAEINRAKALLPGNHINIHLCHSDKGLVLQPYSPVALSTFAQGLNIKLPGRFIEFKSPNVPPAWIDVEQRQERTVKEMEQHVQRVLSLCERTRNKNFWQVLKGDTSAQSPVKSDLREQFRDVIGSLPTPSMPINPHARLLQETAKWTSYEIKLDVWPDVFAWGILIIPKDIKPGEQRPVVVCQHGLEGLPMDVVTTDSTSLSFPFYQGFATKLAERGYITFAPHNPYRGGDKFKVLQRKANPLGLSLFSVIIGQHQRIVEWLGQLSFTDPLRIGFYGLSYGGKAAMRVPALVEGYALSICSGDFNEWVWKNVSVNHKHNYMFGGEYEMPEWDLGHTFNYAEMAGLIAPRPFMVERGHFDLCATDEWLGYEYAKVRRHYDLIGIPDYCHIEYFNEGHMIHGVGTFDFLDKFLYKKKLKNRN